MDTGHEKISFPMPGHGQVDHIVGLSRSSWLRLEESGAIKLVRITASCDGTDRPASRVGKILIPMEEAKKILATGIKKMMQPATQNKKACGWMTK